MVRIHLLRCFGSTFSYLVTNGCLNSSVAEERVPPCFLRQIAMKFLKSSEKGAGSLGDSPSVTYRTTSQKPSSTQVSPSGG